jgi:hypothetical protein
MVTTGIGKNMGPPFAETAAEAMRERRLRARKVASSHASYCRARAISQAAPRLTESEKENGLEGEAESSIHIF